MNERPGPVPPEPGIHHTSDPSEQQNSELVSHIEILTENAQHGHTDEQITIQYVQSQPVGQGSFGVVYQTRMVATDEVFAIKRVLQDRRFKNRELQLMKILVHQNIIDLRYYFYKQNNKNEVYLHLVLEFMPETLFKASHFYLSRRTVMPLLEIRLYSYQLMRALNFVHCKGVCHRDLKPQNLLIDPVTGVLKLCDFGSAKVLSASEPNVSYICTRYYRAPELIFGAVNYTTQIDIWSAACVIGELILGRYLFAGESGIDQLVEIIKILGTPSRDQVKTMNPTYMDHKFPKIKPMSLGKVFKRVPGDCLSFLDGMLQYDPNERFNASQCLIHPFFDELRHPTTKLPDYRHMISYPDSGTPQPRQLPPLFNFNTTELSINPNDNSRLVPAWAHDHLDLDHSFDQFIPLSRESLSVTL